MPLHHWGTSVHCNCSPYCCISKLLSKMCSEWLWSHYHLLLSDRQAIPGCHLAAEVVPVEFPSWKFSVTPLLDLSLATYKICISLCQPPTQLTCILWLLIVLQVPWEVCLMSLLLLGYFPEDGNPLILLEDLSIHLEAFQSAAFLPVLLSLDLSLPNSPPTHEADNLPDLIFLRNSQGTDLTVAPLHTYDHYFISFSFSFAPHRLSPHPTPFQSTITSTPSHT